MNKRIINIFLIFILMLSFNIIGFCAVDDVPVPNRLLSENKKEKTLETKYKTAFELLSYLKIIAEKEEEIDVCEVLKKEFAISSVVKMTSQITIATEKPFSDVPLNNKYINEIYTACEMGILDKTDKFYPENEITVFELSKVVIKSLGHDMFVKNQTYYAYANKIDLLKGITKAMNEAITFGDLLLILQNALHTDKAQITSINYDSTINEATVIKDTDYLRENKNIVIQKGIVTAVGFTGLYKDTLLNNNQIEINMQVFNSDKSFDINLIGKEIYSYIDLTDDKKFVISLWENETKNKVYTVTDSDFSKVEENTFYYSTENDKKKNISISTSAIVSVNDVFFGNIKTAVLENIFENGAKYILIDNNNDSKCDIIKIYKYEDFIVNSVSELSQKISFMYNKPTLDLSENSEYVYVECDNKPIKITEVKKFDIITVIKATRKSGTLQYHLIVNRNSITGVLESTSTNLKGELQYTIDNETYELTDSYMDYLAHNTTQQKPIVGQTATFYISERGKIAASKVSDEYSYGYLMGAMHTENLDTKYKVKIYTIGGKSEEFLLKDKITLYSSAMIEGQTVLAQDAFEEIMADGKVQYTILAYKVNGNILSTLVLPLDRTSYNPGTINYPLTKDYVCTGTSESSRLYTGLLGTLYNVNKTATLIVPKREEDKQDEDNYIAVGSLTTRYSTDKYFDKEVVTLYNAGEFYNPKIATVESASSMATSLDAFTTAVMVDRLVMGLDNNNNSVYKLYYMDNGSISSKIIEDNVKKIENTTKNEDGTSKPIWFGTEDGIEKLSTGDIVQFETNAQGNIISIRILFKYSKSGKYRTQIGNNDSVNAVSKENPMNLIAMIYGKCVNIENNVLIVNVSDDSEDTQYQYPQSITGLYGKNTFTLLKTDEMKIYNVSLNEILPNDIVVLRKRYNNVCDVFLIR